MASISAGGVSSSNSNTDSENPLDLNSAKFDCQTYVSKLLKEKSLKELLGYENNMVQEVNRLDAEMQQLIYENYNKFITATDTVRKMRSDFAGMEEQMDRLAESMQKITTLADGVGASLSTQRDNMQSLAKANRTLKSLQFLYDVPQKLQNHLERKQYADATHCYLQVRSVLEKYHNVASLERINTDCVAIVDELKDALRDTVHERIESTGEVASAVSLLVDLGESPLELADLLLDGARRNLGAELNALRLQTRLKRGDTDDTAVPDEQIRRPSDAIPNLPLDVLEFVDANCSQFLGNLSLVVSSYTKLFGAHKHTTVGPRGDHDRKKKDEDYSKLKVFVVELMEGLFDVVQQRFLLENDPAESSITVRALDRFYRRIMATSQLLPSVNFADSTMKLLMGVATNQIDISVQQINARLQQRIKDTRSQLVAAGPKTLLAPSHNSSGIGDHLMLDETLSRLEQSLVQEVKTALGNLLQFIGHDVTFASKPQFLSAFGRSVRERIVAQFFATVCQLGLDFCAGKGDKAFVNSTLILVLSRFCKNLASSTAGYLLDLSEQQFRISYSNPSADTVTTSTSEVTKKLQMVAQRLLDRYVEMEAFALSQLLVKSVEARDWLGCAEPRSVRAVMKRVLEDLTAVETRVGQLFEEGARRDRSSDSSRRTGGMYSGSTRGFGGGGGRGSSAPLGDSALNSTLGKLWTERIDYFASVEPNKVSVMTGIVKIALKTLLESVRLRTFGKYGLQQVQVDCHYLQLFLWRFVFDEQLVHCLLDEVVSSVVHRCIDAQLMEPSVVRAICERG